MFCPWDWWVWGRWMIYSKWEGRQVKALTFRKWHRNKTQFALQMEYVKPRKTWSNKESMRWIRKDFWISKIWNGLERQRISRKEAWAVELDGTWFISWLWFLLPMWPWTSYFSILIYKLCVSAQVLLGAKEKIFQAESMECTVCIDGMNDYVVFGGIEWEWLERMWVEQARGWKGLRGQTVGCWWKGQ